MHTIDIVEEKSVDTFLSNNENLLLRNESQNNLMLGLADRVLKAKRKAETPLFYTIRLDNKICGQAMRSEPLRPLIISEIENDSLVHLIAHLKITEITLTGVIGPIAAAKVFAMNWAEHYSTTMHHAIYELKNVIHPNYEKGSLFLAEEAHFDLVKEFSRGYLRDCFPNQDLTYQADEASMQNIKNKSLFLWKNSNGEIVSMAASNRESKNSASVSWVYTPKKHRNKGYGSRAVASLSEQLLNRGKMFCNLFAGRFPHLTGSF